MRLTVSVLLLLSLGPSGAGLCRGLGGLRASLQAGEPLQGAKEETGQTRQVQKDQKKPLTNADVIGMVKAGLAESTIVLSIQHSSTDFDTSPQALISLQRQGVPHMVLNAMITAGSEKPTPPSVPPSPTPPNPANGAPAPGGSPKSAETKSSTPDLHKIRKILLEMDWAEDDNARPRETVAIQKHTCLRVVDTLEAADARLNWSNQGLMGAALDLLSKDGQELWSKRGLTAPLKALNLAVGCPK
jgi:hypothetical protein